MYAEECGKLISPPCWKTGRYCSGRLKTPPRNDVTPPESLLLQRARAVGLNVYPHTFRNEVRCCDGFSWCYRQCLPLHTC